MKILDLPQRVYILTICFLNFVLSVFSLSVVNLLKVYFVPVVEFHHVFVLAFLIPPHVY